MSHSFLNPFVDVGVFEGFQISLGTLMSRFGSYLGSEITVQYNGGKRKNENELVCDSCDSRVCKTDIFISQSESIKWAVTVKMAFRGTKNPPISR